MKTSLKSLFRKNEGIWEFDLPDIHNNHFRKLKKKNKKTIKSLLKKQTKNIIKEEVYGEENRNRKKW